MSEPEAKPEPVPLAQHTCAQCKHGITVSPVLTEPLECRCFPPQLWTVQAGSNLSLNCSYPRVARLFAACGQFKARFAS